MKGREGIAIILDLLTHHLSSARVLPPYSPPPQSLPTLSPLCPRQSNARPLLPHHPRHPHTLHHPRRRPPPIPRGQAPRPRRPPRNQALHHPPRPFRYTPAHLPPSSLPRSYYGRRRGASGCFPTFATIAAAAVRNRAAACACGATTSYYRTTIFDRTTPHTNSRFALHIPFLPCPLSFVCVARVCVKF